MPASHVIRVALGRNAYAVRFESDLLRRPAEALRVGVRGRRVFVLADARVAALYGAAVLRSFRRCGAVAELLVFPPGERSKSVRQVEWLARGLVALGADRECLLVGLGGGVATDLAGFVAAVFLRGVEWVALPTSVLAQVDAAIGGKTGVDLPEGKNLVGAFHQPRAVLADPHAVRTLPERHFRAGLAEIVKMGAAVDRGLFEWLERRADRLAARDDGAYLRAAVRAARRKAEIVSRDEREAGRRAWLNYGHTVGHALETLGGYRRWLHGEAVAMGVSVAAELAVRAGVCTRETAERQRVLLGRLGLPTRLPAISARAVLERVGTDKKALGGRPAFVLTRRIGVVSVHRTLTDKELVGALRALGAGP